MNQISLLFIFFIFQYSFGWQTTFSCGGDKKNSVSVDELIVINTDGKPRDFSEESPLTASVKQIRVGKQVFKEVLFKGTRSPSVKENYFFLEPDPPHKVIKSIAITTSDEDSRKMDELVMNNGKIHSMLCTELETLECAPPVKGDKIPKEAVWAGGCDSGVWIQVLDIKSKKARLKIFRASGEIWVQNWFFFAENCQVKSKNILKSDFSSFDGETVFLKRVNPKEEPPQTCFMKLVK